MKNKVVKHHPIQPVFGNLQYWDGVQWIVLPNGVTNQVLMTHSNSIGPTWEFLPGEEPLNPNDAGNISFNATAANGGTGGGTGANLFSAMSGDVHLTMGGDKDPALTVGRDGTGHADTPFLFNTSWNFDDNGGANEIYFLCVKSPLTNKNSTIQYSQKTGPFPALCISVVTVKSQECAEASSSSSSIDPSASTGACALLGGSILIGNGVYCLIVDSSNNTTAVVSGWFWDGFNVQIIDITLSSGGKFTVLTNDIQCVISVDSRDSFVFCGITPTIPPGKIWHAIANAGGLFGGMWWDILNKCRTFSDGLEDTTGHPDLNALYGNSSSSSSSSNSITVLGNWGWYGNEAQTPGASHFIPINFDSPNPNMDVASEFLGVPRSTYESVSYETASVAQVDALAVMWNLFYANTGFWKLLWFDFIARIDGVFTDPPALLSNCSEIDGCGGQAAAERNFSGPNASPDLDVCVGFESILCSDNECADAECPAAGYLTGSKCTSNPVDIHFMIGEDWFSVCDCCCTCTN